MNKEKKLKLNKSLYLFRGKPNEKKKNETHKNNKTITSSIKKDILPKTFLSLKMTLDLLK